MSDTWRLDRLVGNNTETDWFDNEDAAKAEVTRLQLRHNYVIWEDNEGAA